MQLYNLDTFGDAAPIMSSAFFEHDQAAFNAAVESAKDAVAGYPSLLNTLNQAAALFPQQQALELVLQAIADVIEMQRQDAHNQALQSPPPWPYTSNRS